MSDKSECCAALIGLGGLIALLISGGCAPGPRVAPAEGRSPVGLSMERPSLAFQKADPDTSRMIGYRKLRLDDFQGERPPKEFVHHTPLFGAVTCIYLRAEPDLQVFSRLVKNGGDRVEYVADLERVVFRALVDRNCSWWNKAIQGLSPQRVLQHEQIHFALFEIAARKLNARMLALREEQRFRAGSAGGAKRAARRFIDRAMHEAMEELNARNIRFDREVEGGRLPEQQQHWWQQVEAELLETAPYAAAELAPH